jgi:BirA family transcriptional regulator, biotin operon repressor / biotin---[acetyl-CoA-carboxylase] ligase
MRRPADRWIELQETPSTQEVAADLLRRGEDVGVVFAHDQTAGRGRFGRPWHSRPGDSLTFSLIFRTYADHPRPYLVGMATALAVAGVARCKVRWPNDLVIGDRKLGGILTELLPDEAGRRVPVVGVGLNLNQREFPAEIASLATSLTLAHGGEYDAEGVAHSIVSRIEALPEPQSWADLEPVWHLFDRTAGKRYRLPTGEEAVALGVGSEGQLLCSVEGESHAVMAADALFGPHEG